MSKHREQTPVEVEPPAQIAAAPAPVKPVQVEIGTCVGKMVQCVSCGAPAFVSNARGARTATQVISSTFWVLVSCQGFCGKVLRRRAELVTVLPVPLPEPVLKSLGAAVGHFVYCPRCSAKAQAQWSMDEAHTINCPECGTRAYPGDTVVEMAG